MWTRENDYYKRKEDHTTKFFNQSYILWSSKIKEGTPLRPIISNINASTYKLAKYLSKITSPLTGKSAHYVKYSEDFVCKIKEMEIDDNDTMRFDVVSLFTNIGLSTPPVMHYFRAQNR